MSRTSFLFAVSLALIILLAGSVGQAAPSRVTEEGPAFVPGQVLVRLNADAPSRTITSFAASLGAKVVNRIAERTFTLAVPEGEEAAAVEALASAPGVQAASLNYVITEPLSSEDPIPDESMSSETLGQEPPSCITDLWMSTTQQGERLQDNILSSGTPQVYVFFEYTDCELEEVRLQIFYLGQVPPREIFRQEGFVISGSGIQGNKVLAWPQFESGEFPVGAYLTILSLSPEGGWDEAKNALWRVSTFPNDHWFQGNTNFQWPLHSTGRRAQPQADINMPQAWDITTGSPDTVIAVVSSGVWLDHPDLKNKIWLNRNEIPDNGIDDDENGCVDDIHGCEFFEGEASPNPADIPRGPGTFTAGVVAAETNNGTGMAGVSWGTRILPVKVLRLRPDGVLAGQVADLITAIDYAVANNARIIHIGPRLAEGNVSDEQLELLRSVIDDATSQGALIITGTGDSGEPQLSYPARFENVVAVGCSDVRNQRCWLSNYDTGVDLVAPGDLILSTYFSEQSAYATGRGTNLAAAHVEGVASLIWSVNPELSPSEVRAILQESAADLGPVGYDEEYGYGRLDAWQAIAETTHHVWLHTANHNRSSLLFLLDDQMSRMCHTVWNYGTAPNTWTLTSNSEWLTVEEQGERFPTPVPSHFGVCADSDSFDEAGTYQTQLEANSTLTFNDGPAFIDVTAIYRPHLPRIYLSFVQRP